MEYISVKTNPHYRDSDILVMFAAVVILICTIIFLVDHPTGNPREVLPSWMYPLLQPAITALVGLFAIIMAVKQIDNQRKIARDKNTFDFIIKYETDTHINGIRAEFSNIDDGDGSSMASLFRSDHVDDAKLAQKYRMIDFMNLLEAVAIAVENGTLDRQTISDMYSEVFKLYWDQMKYSVEELRHSGSCCENFEKLVKTM
jgi:hypothetical protein